jgi:hypothetical protein
MPNTHLNGALGRLGVDLAGFSFIGGYEDGRESGRKGPEMTKAA